MPLIVLYSLISCIRTPMQKGKWLWIIFILIGVCQFSLNWTTGQLNINPLSINLFGLGVFSSSQYAPIFISLGIPLGAIVYLVLWKMLKLPGEKGADTAS